MTLNGIDISGWQAGIDLTSVPCDFVIVKATGGAGFVSQSCDPQYQAAKAAGKKVGIYHFAREAGCGGTAEQEADFFLAQTQGYHDGATLLVLDWEGDNTYDVNWAKTWLDRVYAATGVKPVIYMSQSVVNAFDWSAVAAADYGLWVAQYATMARQGYGPLTDAPAISHWSTLAMWQYTSAGSLPNWNGSLDLDVFYGDESVWDAYCRPSGAPAPVAAPKPTPAPVAAPKPAPAPAPKAPAVGGQCTVTSGDTISGIAAQVGVSLAAMEAVNPGINYDRIDVGQILNLPAGANLAALTGNAPAAPAAVSQCVVESGDTLSSIAAQFGTTVAHLAAVNGISDPNRIYAGQVLNF